MRKGKGIGFLLLALVVAAALLLANGLKRTGEGTPAEPYAETKLKQPDSVESALESYEDPSEQESSQEEPIPEHDIVCKADGLSEEEQEAMRADVEQVVTAYMKTVYTLDAGTANYTHTLNQMFQPSQLDTYEELNTYFLLSQLHTLSSFEDCHIAQTILKYSASEEKYLACVTGYTTTEIQNNRLAKDRYCTYFVANLMKTKDGWKFLTIHQSLVYKADGFQMVYADSSHTRFTLYGTQALCWDFTNPIGFLTDYQEAG